MAWQEYQTIWLQPWCEKCEAESLSFKNDGRQWCQDNAWDKCDLCERRPVKYEISLKTADRKQGEQT